MSSNDFRVWIAPIKSDRFDWRVTIQRLTDGTTRHERVSGGWVIAEAAANALARQLGLPNEATL